MKRSELKGKAPLCTALSYVIDRESASPVRVEIDVHRGLPAFSLIGLPELAVRESRERIRAALLNSEFEFPLRRIVVNLSRPSLRKAAPGMDLAIAVALLVASRQIELDTSGIAFVGELSLSGNTRSVPGVFHAVQAARNENIETIVIPVADADKVPAIDGIEVISLGHLAQVVSPSGSSGCTQPRRFGSAAI